ncbi:MAG: SBBP repeat-containing protein [Bacteroidota bacterium]
MKKASFLSFLLAILASFFTSAQLPDNVWAKQFGFGAAYLSAPKSMITDAAGNVYVAGTFDVTNDFDPGPGVYNLTSNGGADIFIMKLDVNGNMVWVKQIGGMPGDDIAGGIAFDKAGDLFITGYFFVAVDFDPGNGSDILTAQGSFSDIFIMKMDTGGNLVWVKQAGGEDGEGTFGISLDEDDNILVSGNFWSTADFDPGPAVQNLTAWANADNFILKLNHDGDFVWVKQIGGPSVAILPFSIKTDRNNNVIIAGHFNGGTCDFDPGPGTNSITSVNGYTGYVQKLDENGNLVWVSRFTGNTSNTYMSGLYVAPNGNIYTVGNFDDTVDFDPGPAVYDLYSPGSGMVIKLDSNGVFNWVKSIAYGAMCITGNSNEIFIGGSAPTPSAKHAVSKMDIAGNLVWDAHLGNASFVSVANTICIDSFKNIYTAGYFSSTADFDPGAGLYELTSVAESDIFVHKLSEIGVLAINFISINATSLQPGNLIEWLVRPELQNIGKFKLERSNDGINFFETGTINLVQSLQTYSFLDAFALPGIHYYRVRFVNGEGRETISKVVTINRQKANTITLWPNPVKGTVNIRSDVAFQNAVIKIFDSKGKLILKKEHCNGNAAILDCTFLAAAVYVLEIEDKAGKKALKLIRQ